MPLEGFVQALATQQDIVKQLIEAGVLKEGAAQDGNIPEKEK